MKSIDDLKTMWMNEYVIVFLVVQRITCGVTFGGPSGGQTTTVPAPAVYKKLDCSDVYNMQKVGLYLSPLGDQRVGFTKIVQPNEYFSIFGDDTISCDVRVIAIKSDYYLKVTTDKSFDIISSSLQELLQLDSNSRTSFVADSNTVKPNDPLILKKGLRHYASYTETHLTSIKYNRNKYKDVATPHLLEQTTPFTPNMELEVYVGYKCEAVNPNQLKICWPTHPGDVQGTYQINKKCEGVVNGFNDTEIIIETQSCNSTIGWTAWSDWHLSEEEGEDPMGSENITIWRNATSCMQQGDGMSNETDVVEYWCGAEIYHIRTVQKDEYRYSDYFWAGDGECQLYHPERQVMDHLNNQEDPPPTCGSGFQVFIQTTCVKGPYSLTPESPDLCPPPGFHIVDCYIECPDQNDDGKSIEHDVEDLLVDELQSEHYNESSPLRMNMKWLPAYENTYTNGLPQAKSPDQNFIELQIKLNQPVFFERIELKLQPMPIGYPYGQVTFTSSKDSGRTWSNSSNVTYMSSGDTWVVFSPMEVKYLSDIKFHFDMQITDQTIFQVIAFNKFKTKNWGNWSVWSNWTTCTNQDCLADNATWYRTRNCDNWRNDAIITINAKQCPGRFMEVAKCKCLDKFRWDEVNELEISQCEDFQTKGTSSLEPPPPDCGHGVINIAPSRCRYEGGNTMEYEDEYPHLCGTKNIQSTPCVKPCNGSYPCGEQALAETVRCSTPKYQLLPNDVIIENITFQNVFGPVIVNASLPLEDSYPIGRTANFTKDKDWTFDLPAFSFNGTIRLDCRGVQQVATEVTVFFCPAPYFNKTFGPWRDECGNSSRPVIYQCRNPLQEGDPVVHDAFCPFKTENVTEDYGYTGTPCYGYSNWSEWSGCNESPYCGHTANQTRTRNCTIDGLVQPDETCLRSNFTWATNETQSCFNLRIRCFRWTGWGDWTVNGTACETFQEYKERFCQIDSPLVWFGRPEDELDYKWVNVSASHNLTCGMTTDPVHGEVLEVIVRTNVTNIPCFIDPVTQWTDWSDCDRPCGTGNKIRTRDCQGDIDDCKAYHFKEEKICNTDLCPINAVWTLWTDWTSCSGSCGTGSQIRTRFCSPPQHGGAACGEPVPEDYGGMIFKHVENRDCTHNASCPGFRMEEGNCTHICHEQNLACNFLLKKNGSDIADAAGIPCEDYTDHEHLYEPAINEDGNCLGFNKVPVEFICDANSPPGQKRLCDCVPSDELEFGEWSQFGECKVIHTSDSLPATCGQATRMRFRKTVSADDTHTLFDIQQCDLPDCPIPGNWSTWTGFGECNVTCGDGMRNSTRKCDNPVPQNGGRKCEGPEVRYEECGEPKKCPVHGGWSSWSLYSECQGACQYEDIPISRSYIRICDNPEPDYGGRKCAGDKFKSEKCDLKPCQSVKADTVVQFYGERFSTELKDLNSQKAMDLKEKLEKGIREEYLSNHPQIAEDSDYIKVTVHSFSDGSGFEPKAITKKKN